MLVTHLGNKGYWGGVGVGGEGGQGTDNTPQRRGGEGIRVVG